jgi:polar amino acid transport system ATP-binding protein
MKLNVQGVSKSFGTHRALRSVTLDIPDGQNLVLIGPSGGGKSTLLRLLAGLEVPDHGWIAFDDQKIQYDEESLIRYRKSIGVVFQSWNLFPHLTALENIVLPLVQVHGLSPKEAHERALALLKRFDLARHANKKPFGLSGGQSQRVALIRAVAAQPKILMLDEPTSALDPLMTAEVLELIEELKKDLRDLVLVTHHLQFARRIADHVVFLADGKILEQGSPEELFENPQAPLVQEYMSKVLAY